MLAAENTEITEKFKTLSVISVFSAANLFWLLSFACAQTSLPPPKPPSTEPATTVQPQKTVDSEPQDEMVKLAQKVHTRLRYFGEEMKTTYKPEKQKALFADTRKTVRPACDDMKRIIADAAPSTRGASKETAAACDRIDSALEKQDLDLLKKAIRDFAAAYEKLKTQ